MSKLPRVAALVGPFASGKTSLLESLLLATKAITRKGSVKEGNAVGDSSPEARARMMSVELTVASTFYLDDPWTFIDCPGSVEFMQDTLNTLMVADAAVVVVEPDPARAVMAAPLLKFLDDHGVPHLIFINKCEAGDVRLSETMEAFQAISDRPLVLRELPLREKGELVGFVDLVSERAWRYRAGQPSEMVRMPDSAKPIEESARQEMLEHLADLDDHLLEELLEEVPPPTDEVYDNLAKDLAADLIVPVFFGSATADHGITRLLKALRHEVPEPRQTALRQGIEADGGPVARVFKTVHAQHTGKMSLARVWRGAFAENSVADGRKIAGLFGPQGATMTKVQSAQAGDVVGFARLDDVATGGMLGDARESWAPWPQPLPRLFSLSLQAVRKGDDVKLSGALTKLSEEDPSLTLEHSAETGEMN
ncbi:MAG: elongation factor G, partial [Alphaproteobacteria bacterium]|nr:elongation factor G [Alphaproteobacteria bacterium]